MRELIVADPCDEIEPQPEPAAPAPVFFRNYPEALDKAYGVLVGGAPARNRAVPPPVPLGQGVASGTFPRQLGVRVHFRNPLVPRIGHKPNPRRDADPRLPEKPEVMPLPVRERRAYYLAAPPAYDHLRLYGVPLFLAGIEPSLFFLGRSIGVSVASTSTTS